MIPTTPGPGDIPTGPERPGPVRGPSTGELEGLKKTVQDLLVQAKTSRPACRGWKKASGPVDRRVHR